MHKPFIVILDRMARQSAVEHAERTEVAISDYGPNYCTILNDNRYFVGRCGELAVNLFGEAYWLDYEDVSNDLGITDKEDHIWHPSGLTSNVKNSNHPRARFMMQPKAQQDRNYYQDYYIGATGIDTGEIVTMTLHGAIHINDWKARCALVMRDVWTYQLPLANLPISMADFAKIMEPEDITKYIFA